MATVQDIRAWAEATGQELPGRGVTAAVRKAYDEAHNTEDANVIEETVTLDDVPEERPPSIIEPKPLDKLRSLTSRVKSTGTRKRAKPSKPRHSVDRFISRGWQFLAQAMQPISMPTARVLDVQAPVAGLVLEDVVRNTLVDKVLQPLVRAEAAGEVVYALLGPPAIVAAIHRRPEMFPFLAPFLKEALRSWIDVAGDKIQVAKERDQKFEEEYGKKIDEMIEYFFQDIFTFEKEPPSTVKAEVA